jgi:hypothetical protein
MERFALIPLAGGVVLLVTWIAAPAAPRPVGPHDLAGDQPAAATQVDTEVRRLRERLTTTIEYPAPVRNPFRFVPKPEPRRPTGETREIDVVPVAPPEPVLPVLVGITTPAGAEPRRSAILKIGGDDIRIVKAGERFGDLVIQTIESDAIVLVDPATSRSYRIVLQ